ncbi:hypothetical protein LTR95_008147 [Oleoguttula sp. CCFEE 5521]
MADASASRELVFCHSCENEWYRAEHGLVCPECRSDFTEIIEQPASDPRLDPTHLPPDSQPQHPLQDHNPWEASDPEEEDIGGFRFERNAPGQPVGGTYRTTINRTVTLDAQGRPVIEGGEEGGGGGIMSLIGGALQGVIGPAVQQLLAQHQQQQNQQQRALMPGSPQQGDQHGNNASGFTHNISGPGYSIHVTSSSIRGSTSPALHPRDANAPQPLDPQPDHLQEMMRQMFMNIGGYPALPGQAQQGFPPQMGQMGPGGFMFGSAPPGGPGTPQDLFQQMMQAATGGAHGDAVYSQESLDRIVTQLMEQHSTGNAPGPASQNAIKSLPTRALTEADFGHDGKADCSICMSEVELGERVTELPCGHWFHGECVGAWLRQTDTCPHCRRGIVAREGDGNAVRAPHETPAVDVSAGSQPMPGQFPTAAASGSARSGGAGGVFSSMRNAFGGGSNNDDNGGGSASRS